MGAGEQLLGVRGGARLLGARLVGLLLDLRIAQVELALGLGDGLVSVVLASYLAVVGLSDVRIGIVVTLTLLGSAFGLGAAEGVMAGLRAAGRGFAVGPARVPIVPGAILFDLLNGGDKGWTDNPYPALGRQALDAAAAFLPQLAFLDIGMPRMDGYETARRLRAIRPSRPARRRPSGPRRTGPRRRIPARRRWFRLHS